MIQGGAVFPSLTPDDHLRLASLVARRRGIGGTGQPLVPFSATFPSRHGPAGLLSGGQRQALAVASILASNPAVLLCDEPSAGLAPGVARELMEQIALLSRERALSVLWVEQRVGDVLPLADRAVLLRDGRPAAETSSPREWLGDGVLAELTFGGATRG